LQFGAYRLREFLRIGEWGAGFGKKTNDFMAKCKMQISDWDQDGLRGGNWQSRGRRAGMCER
jgi:hypothetical protein